MGLIPENELSVGAGVELDPRTRGAVVDQSLQTGVPGILPAETCCTCRPGRQRDD
ncbi:MAG: hypothetical protein ACLU0O_11605 [Collinsella sp.]